MTVNITGLNKAEVVAALYNAAKPQGLGFFQYDAKPMTAEQAEQYVGRYLDYVNGRVMKLQIDGDEFREGLYDRDNGQGAAQRVIDSLRKSGNVANADIQNAHISSVVTSIAEMRQAINEPTTIEKGERVVLVNLGVGALAEPLRNKLDEVQTNLDQNQQ